MIIIIFLPSTRCRRYNSGVLAAVAVTAAESIGFSNISVFSASHSLLRVAKNSVQTGGQ